MKIPSTKETWWGEDMRLLGGKRSTINALTKRTCRGINRQKGSKESGKRG